jgi:hypothetical protein
MMAHFGDDELNLISGVYKVLTGELHHHANYCIGFNLAWSLGKGTQDSHLFIFFLIKSL